MQDFPLDVLEFKARFSTEAACREYLFRLRWPEGFSCPRCGGRKAWPVSGVWLQCSNCRYQSSVTAGTLFQDSREPLTLWFRAVWWVTSQKYGVSSMDLKRELGLKTNKTAWTWLHKMRRAMAWPERDRLTGRVEVDEAYLGGLDHGLRGYQKGARALVAVAVQQNGRDIGRVRIRRIADASKKSLVAFVQDSIEVGSVVHTGPWLGYLPLERKGYDYEVAFPNGKKATHSELMPRVHRVVSLAKRWLMGTYQGVRLEHLDHYLDEFTFRFNRRKSRSGGKLFFNLLQQAVAVDPVTYKSMIKW